jgi:hypothetical protein
VPDKPDVPDVPDVPVCPDVPVEPLVPSLPEEPEAPEVPEVPEVPPEVPDVPLEPVDALAPLEPEEPAPLAETIVDITLPSSSTAKALGAEPEGTLNKNRSCLKTDCPGLSRLLENFLFSAIYGIVHHCVMINISF